MIIKTKVKVNSFKFEIPGEPMAKQRPRHGKGYTYTPEKTKNYETLVKELYCVKNGPHFMQQDIIVAITAYFQIPKSKSKKIQAQMLSGDIRPHKKPDWDNVGKIICDALNGLAYWDDSQIIEAVVKKYYSNEPKVIVEITAQGGN